MSTTTIYVLKLKYNKYYVGKTSNVANRILEHFIQDAAHKASTWTSKYSPISIEEIIENCDDFDEDKYTKIYMSKHGIQNVRGGSYTKLVLSEDDVNHLLTELRGARNACYYCGSDGHFINDCTRLYMSKKKDAPIKYERDKKRSGTCYRCGRPGHMQNKCYARTHINGYQIRDRVPPNEKKPYEKASSFFF